jgi:hypothetical protein
LEIAVVAAWVERAIDFLPEGTFADDGGAMQEAVGYRGRWLAAERSMRRAARRGSLV